MKKNLLQKNLERVINIYKNHQPMEANKIILKGLIPKSPKKGE